MNYLISLFDCNLLCGANHHLIEGVKYQIEFEKEESVFYVNNADGILCLLDEKRNSNVLKVKNLIDNYFFIFPTNRERGCVQFMFKSKIISIELFENLKISVDGKILFCERVSNVEFSDFEIDGNFCYIYFSGKRNFVAIIKNEVLCFAGFCDECNFKKEEKYFLTRLNDSLNHGRVCHIEKGEAKTYLVYLDDDDMNLKDEFVCSVFLDCLLAGNFKYCNQLLSDTIKMKKDEEVKEFFPNFDYYYLIERNKVILLNKKTLAGIFEFCVNNKQITNITQY